MAGATITYLTFLAIVLLIGILSSIVSKKIRLPNVLLLLLFGILLNNIYYKGKPLVYFPTELIAAIAVLAIAIIVFDSTSRLKIKEFDTFAFKSLYLTIIFMVLSIAVITVLAYYLFHFNIFYSIMFASLLAGTAPEVVLSIMKETKSKVVELLEIESVINTPLVVLIPFIVLDMKRTIGTFAVENLISQTVPFLQQLVSGIGAGILVGLVVFKLMRRYYSEWLSPIAMIAATLLSYVIAENLGGNGVLAVTVMGLFFGSVYVKEKAELQAFSSIFSHLLMILVFVMVGLLIDIFAGWVFMLKAFGIYLVICLVRYLSLNVTVGKEFKKKEIIFMTFNAPKGIAVAVVVLLLSTLNLENIIIMLDLALVVMLYSIVISSIFVGLSKYFIGKDVVKK